ncbi:MAG: sulfatase-like hydrolase/transferase [Saprospiraceae bacterium]
MSKQELKFWMIALVLNSLLYLPAYLGDIAYSCFFCWSSWGSYDWNDTWELMFMRYNYDVFRISVDFFLATAVYLLLQKYLARKWFSVLFFLGYSTIFIFQIYHHSFSEIYKVEPMFYNDWFMLQGGYELIMVDADWKVAAAIVGILGLFYGLYRVLTYYLRLAGSVSFGKWSKGITVALSLMIGVGIYKHGITNVRPRHQVSSQLAFIRRNVNLSRIAKGAFEKIDLDFLLKQDLSKQYPLQQKPNVHFIFIESYGNLIYRRPNLLADFKTYMPNYEAALAKAGWQMGSRLSTAPGNGGGSWVCYSSALFGFDFQHHANYMTLLQTPKMYQYQQLHRYLHDQNYKVYWLNSPKNEAKLDLPWDAYTQFYAVDEWIRFGDLNYQGPMYGFGPCPPDQYTLNFAKDYIETQSEKPYVLFYLTKNSHLPFDSPTNIVEDYRSLSTNEMDEQKSVLLAQGNLEAYANAIRYQWEMLVDLILKKGKPEDIYIFAGDHQPPMLTQRADGFETPFHVITQDSVFLQQFLQHGFEPGLLIDSTAKPMTHQTFHSLFLNAMVKANGVDTLNLPPFLPRGYEF